MKNKKVFIKSIYLISLISSITAVVLNFSHIDGAGTLLTIGIIASLIFILFSICEVSFSKRIEGTEKMMWIVGLLCITSITGFVYVFSARKRIVNIEISKPVLFE